LRTVTRPEKINTSRRVRHVAVRKFLPVLLALLAMLMLLTACSKDSANSGDSASTPLDDALASGKPTLAGFVGQECACKNIRPILEELAVEYDGRCNVVTIDVSEHKGLARQYGIMLTPTQAFFDSNGAEVERIVGSSTKEEMVERLAGIGVE
jgi:thioredoxin 1